MALSKEVIDYSNARIAHAQEIYTLELSSVSENIRWLATLALAEIAGLAAYRQLTGQHRLSLSFAVVVIALALAVVAFVMASVVARYERRRLIACLHEISSLMLRTETDGSVAPDDGAKDVQQFRENRIESLPKVLRLSSRFECFGLILLGVASVLAAIALFLSELIAIFRP